jgi:sugar transferase (PEP-CTERM/EpsH1 system associated)
VGGLENGLVNLINHMPEWRYRHAILCLTDSTDFRDRIQREDVPVIALHKRPGKDFASHARFLRVLKRTRPDVVHTRNLSALEYLVTAALAGVPGRVHGEHGRDVGNLDVARIRYKFLRQLTRPFVHRYITVSLDLAESLVQTLGVRRDRIRQTYNGVDSLRFHPRAGVRPPVLPEGFAPPESLVVGTVGRMETVKDQLTLTRAFAHVLSLEPTLRQRLRLVLVGDGSLRERAQRILKESRTDDLAWLPGERSDIPECMRAFDLFVLPSLNEGISNTILEAMATGLPVVATRVGGNPELVQDRQTGWLVPPDDPAAMAEAIRSYLDRPDQLNRHGEAGRKRVETHFSMEAMVNGYMGVYDEVLRDRRR